MLQAATQQSCKAFLGLHGKHSNLEVNAGLDYEGSSAVLGCRTVTLCGVLFTNTVSYKPLTESGSSMASLHFLKSV